MANDLLQTTLAVSLTAISLLRPILGAAEELLDFTLEYINPAGQRMTGLPERPVGTLCTLFPHAHSTGLLDFYRRVYSTSQASTFDFTYRGDEADSFYLVAAQRSGELLVVSLTNSAQQERPAVEQALRASQAREQAARREVERERNLLEAILTQAPVAIGLFRGPEQVVVTANTQLCAMWGYAPADVLGRPLLDGVPELRGQGFAELIAEVAHTQVPYVGREVPAQLTQQGQLQTHYFNFVYQPLHSPRGELLGVLDIAIDVTEQVLARQQVQSLNEELAAANEELQAANEEFFSNNEALTHAQLKLQQLNQELERRVAERTQALAQALADAEHQRQRLARFFNQAPAAICIFDGPDFVYELVNPAYQRLFPGRHLLGRPLLAALPELAHQPGWRTLRHVYETGQTHEEMGILMPIATYEGGPLQDFYFHYIQQARYDEQGRIDGVLVFVLDMTEQVLAQQRADALQAEVLTATRQQVRQREELYQLFERTPAAICLLRGPEHRFEYFNPSYQALFPGRSMWGHTVAEIQPEAIEQGFVALLDHVYQSGETYYGNELPLRVEQADGSPPKTTYFNFTYQAYHEDGQPAGISVFAFDVTEQVLARQQRAAQQQQLRELFEQAPVAIAVFQGPQYLIEFANPAVCRLWGRTPQQALHTPLFEQLPEAAGQGFEQLLDGVMATGVPHVAHELMVLIDRDGRRDTVYLNFVYQPLRNAEGQSIGVTMVATEVTEQVAARRQVQALNEELQAANQELQATNSQLTRTNIDLDNFIYTASHDLKAPITNIEGLLTALQEQLPAKLRQDEQVQPLLRMMEGAVERFQKTIGHLTDISKLQQAHAQAEEVIDLVTLLDEVALDLAPELASTKAQLLVDVAACPSLSFSPKNLRSIFYNLLSNAIKYRAPGRPPLIELRCHSQPGRVILEVQDNGLGLDEAQQSQLFGMFQRLHSHVEGSGIGLYMVKKIVENAGGTITVRSEPGVGSTFSIVLPG
ncbi:PAS domain-containing protein [Hymenobacter sp. BRD128]|uniref:PAS domain-containing protein n=1 Tax=Hymenobacter sp. BRD128 TaxID=2675878 RepID=UPI0015634AE3|nr:PAS domain-containing protein [Hymenobacter sp. BRD128]QKG56887.1 PAS domain-containing protein [Hymenobacter sp. BRD128]